MAAFNFSASIKHTADLHLKLRQLRKTVQPVPLPDLTSLLKQPADEHSFIDISNYNHPSYTDKILGFQEFRIFARDHVFKRPGADKIAKFHCLFLTKLKSARAKQRSKPGSKGFFEYTCSIRYLDNMIAALEIVMKRNGIATIPDEETPQASTSSAVSTPTGKKRKLSNEEEYEASLESDSGGDDDDSDSSAEEEEEEDEEEDDEEDEEDEEEEAEAETSNESGESDAADSDAEKSGEESVVESVESDDDKKKKKKKKKVAVKGKKVAKKSSNKRQKSG